METIAVIKTGGKQYKVTKDQELNIELIDKAKTEKIDFNDLLEGKKVIAQILDTVKGPKISNMKFKNKTRYKKRIGHRQKYTKIKILEIK